MSIHLSFRIEPELKEKLEQRAKTRNQTITAYILDKTVFEPEQEEQNKVLLEQIRQKDRQIEELQKLLIENNSKSFFRRIFSK